MSNNGSDINNLDGYDTEILKKQGWFFVTYFQSREGVDGSKAYNNAMEKALSIEREVGLRSYVKDDITYWEVWEHW